MGRTKIRESVAVGSIDINGKTGERLLLRIIAPGQGSTGFYTAENLAASLDKFKPGTHMYMDHDRYGALVRSVEDLVGRLSGDPYIGEDGAIYCEAEVYSSKRDYILERADAIGVSISALIPDTMEEGGIVPPLLEVLSVDFVTKPGAGGVITDVLESAKDDISAGSEEQQMEKRIAALEEAVNLFNKRVESLETAAKAAKEAVEAPFKETTLKVAEALKLANKIKEADLPEAAKERVIARVSEGAAVEAAIADELTYVTAIRESAQVREASVEESVDTAKPISGFVGL